MRLGRSLYHQDGSLRRPVFIGGVIVLTIPVVLFAIFTVLQFTGKDGDPPAEEKKPLVVSKQPITGEKKQNTAKASVKKGGAGAGSRNSDRPGVERRILGLTGRKLPEVGASFRADAQALTLARDPASVAAWERLLSWDSTNFSDSDRCWYAVALCESGSLAKGSALINWLVARLPKSADVQTAAGRCAFLRGDTEAAEACFKRAVALRSDRALPEKGTLQSLVLAEWAEAAGVPPGEAAAGEQGPEQEGEAETDPAEAQKVAQLRADAMRMTVSGDRTAREAWKRLFLSHPESAGDGDRGWYAVALCETGLLKDGGALIKLLLSDAPEDADLQALAGRCAFLRGELEEARQHLSRALELEAGHPHGKRWFAEVAGAIARGAPGPGQKAAGEGADRAAGIPDDEAGEENEVSRLRADATTLMSQDDPNSMVVWERFLRIHLEEFSDIDRCWYAVSLCENGMLFEGGELMDILFHRLAESADLHAAAGRCAFLRGKEQQAWWHLSRALKLNPQHVHAERWFRRMVSTNVLAPVFLALPGQVDR